MIRISPTLSLDDDAVTITFVRSRGPGGQNVNKVNSCALLSFDLHGGRALDDTQRARLVQALGARLTRDGRLLLRCDTHRTAEANRRAVLDRFARVIGAALRPVTPRRPTRPTRASAARRRSEKARRSAVKQSRRRAPRDGD